MYGEVEGDEDEGRGGGRGNGIDGEERNVKASLR